MAISPDDCVVRIRDLVIGQEDCVDMFGRADKRPVYEKYWQNFCRHTDKLKVGVKWTGHGKDPWQQVVDDELAKYGASLKRTKEYKNNYIKFKSHKHFTMFVLRWS